MGLKLGGLATEQFSCWDLWYTSVGVHKDFNWQSTPPDSWDTPWREIRTATTLNPEP